MYTYSILKSDHIYHLKIWIFLSQRSCYKTPVDLDHSTAWTGPHYRCTSEVKLGGTNSNVLFKCTKCEQSHPAALDCHHVDPREKENMVSYFVSNGNLPQLWKK